METDYSALIKQHKQFIEKVLLKKKMRFPLLLCSGKMRAVKRVYKGHESLQDNADEFHFLSKLTDDIDRNGSYRFWNKCLNQVRDFMFQIKYRNYNGKITKKMRSNGEMYLAIVCIIKNEARYISEWIAYYKLMGVDHIFLFDNGSSDNIGEVVADEEKDGFVTLIKFHGKNAQLPLYRLTAKALKRCCRWVAYIDADEFILPTESTLKCYLEKKESVPAVGINWIVFGTGGHVKRPDGLVTENYLQTFEDVNNLLNLRIKCIVDPKEVYDVSSPHYCILKNGRYAVDEEGEEITAKWMHVSGSGAAFTEENKTKHIRINHYWTKSEQDLQEKCNRGYAAGSFSPDYEDIMKRLDYPQKADYAIAEYVPDIKKLLKKRY